MLLVVTDDDDDDNDADFDDNFDDIDDIDDNDDATPLPLLLVSVLVVVSNGASLGGSLNGLAAVTVATHVVADAGSIDDRPAAVCAASVHPPLYCEYS